MLRLARDAWSMVIRLRQATNEYAPLKRFLYNEWKKRNERLNVGGVSIRSRNGAPSRKERVVNDHTTKARNN